MRFNEKEIAEIVSGPADFEGRLSYCKVYANSGSQCGAFKDRWFKLKHNLLFYFRITEMGRVDIKQPVGLFVLENSNIHYEMYSGAPFAFSIIFGDEPDKKYVFSGRCEENTQEWIAVLKKATYEYLRSQLITLQTMLHKKTGKDPLLMYPRNQGVIRGAQSSEANAFEPHDRERPIGPRSSTFQSHIMKSASEAHILDSSPPCPPRRANALARSATTATANVRTAVSSLNNDSIVKGAPAPAIRQPPPQNLIEL